MPTVSKLFHPSPQLSGCMFAGIFRDTRGVDLSDGDRMNHFPASPLVAVTQVLSGELWLVPVGEDWPGVVGKIPLPSFSVTGPQNTPTSSWASGESAAFTVGFYHDAWLALGGAADCSRVPKDIAEAMHCFAIESNPQEGWIAFCNALIPVWAKSRPTAWPGIVGIGDWAKAVASRAALSGSGRSLRSLERRIKRASGQTQRSLDFYGSFENLHRIAQQFPQTSLAEIAQEAGFADQSHMGRSVRRATGYSPARLNRAIETKEAFWCYRLLGERF